MDTMVDKCGTQSSGGEGSKGTSSNKTKERHVQINSNLDINSKLKKHYEPLEIQVRFNINDENSHSKNTTNRNYYKDDKATTLLTKSQHLDSKREERTETDDLANLLARIHRRDDDTVHLLTERVEFLTSELAKRNTIIFSLLKHLDFVINQDISTVRTNKQLGQYLNNNKEVYIKDVISSSRWNPDNKNNNERISEDDWQLDVFQYIKNYIDKIDTILMPAAEANGETAADSIHISSDEDSSDTNDDCENTGSSHCSKHKLNTLPPPEIPDIDCDVVSPDDVKNDDSIWPPETIALIGDNMLHGIDEKRLGGKNWNVKCRMFPESHVSDFFHYVTPILNKKPSHLVFHIGTNDAPHFAPRDIYDGIMSLKRFVEKHLTTCKVIISKPIIRMDNCQANLTILKVNQFLDSAKILTIDNGNFGLNHLSKKGPNLNPKGTARLAMNIISQLKSMLNEGGTNAQTSSTDVSHAPGGSFMNASRLNPDAKSFNPLPLE